MKSQLPAPATPPQQLTRLASDLRLACMRISRRVRFESSHDVAPHQFSVLCRLEDAPRTPGELAEIGDSSALRGSVGQVLGREPVSLWEFSHV